MIIRRLLLLTLRPVPNGTGLICMSPAPKKYMSYQEHLMMEAGILKRGHSYTIPGDHFMYRNLKKGAGCFCFSPKDEAEGNRFKQLLKIKIFTMRLKNSLIVFILLLPLFFSPVDGKYTKASATSACIAQTSCMKNPVNKILKDDLSEKKSVPEPIIRERFRDDFHVILH